MKPIPEMTDAELDVAMAVEVMGWHKADFDFPYCMTAYATGKEGIDNIMCIDDFNPTSDLNQVWECADEMNKRGWILELGYEYRGVRPNGLPMQYRAYADDDKQWFEALSESPARAMCEALLQAVREEQ